MLCAVAMLRSENSQGIPNRSGWVESFANSSRVGPLMIIRGMEGCLSFQCPSFNSRPYNRRVSLGDFLQIRNAIPTRSFQSFVRVAISHSLV